MKWLDAVEFEWRVARRSCIHAETSHMTRQMNEKSMHTESEDTKMEDGNRSRTKTERRDRR